MYKVLHKSMNILLFTDAKTSGIINEIENPDKIKDWFFLLLYNFVTK